MRTSKVSKCPKNPGDVRGRWQALSQNVWSGRTRMCGNPRVAHYTWRGNSSKQMKRTKEQSELMNDALVFDARPMTPDGPTGRTGSAVGCVTNLYWLVGSTSTLTSLYSFQWIIRFGQQLVILLRIEPARHSLESSSTSSLFARLNINRALIILYIGHTVYRRHSLRAMALGSEKKSVWLPDRVNISSAHIRKNVWVDRSRSSLSCDRSTYEHNLHPTTVSFAKSPPPFSKGRAVLCFDNRSAVRRKSTRKPKSVNCIAHWLATFIGVRQRAAELRLSTFWKCFIHFFICFEQRQTGRARKRSVGMTLCFGRFTAIEYKNKQKVTWLILPVTYACLKD